MTDHERDLATTLLAYRESNSLSHHEVWMTLCRLQGLDLRVEGMTSDALRAFLAAALWLDPGTHELKDDWLGLWQVVVDIFTTERTRTERARYAHDD